MKRSIIGSISLAVIGLSSVFSPGVNATPSSTSETTTPVNLVNLARNGYFQDRGIPSYLALETAIARGQVNAETLIQAAVEENKIASETLNDEGYLRQVEMKLDLINSD
jgi:hypothetical protein